MLYFQDIFESIIIINIILNVHWFCGMSVSLQGESAGPLTGTEILFGFLEVTWIPTWIFEEI